MNEFKRPVVLVVDDDAEIALILKRLIENRLDADVDVATDIVTARDKLKKRFDLVTVDFQMPDCDGLSLLVEIRGMPDPPPVIIVTGHGDEKVAVDAFRLGASGYVVKDAKMPELLIDSINKGLMASKLKATEDDLRASRQAYLDIVETAKSIILRLDPVGTIMYMNPYGLEFFGYTEEELIGRNARGTIIGSVESSGRDLDAMVAEVLRNPDAFAQNINQNIKRSGERVWILWANKAISDADGRPAGNYSIGTDVTALVHAEDSLQEHIRLVEYQALILENLNEAIITYDTGSLVTSWSKGAELLYGFTAEEALGRHAVDLLRIDYPEGDSLERRMRAIIEKGLHRFESSNHRKDGRVMITESSVWPLKDKDGNLNGFVALHQDITEQRLALAELQRQRDILDQVDDAIFVTDAASPDNNMTGFPRNT